MKRGDILTVTGPSTQHWGHAAGTKVEYFSKCARANCIKVRFINQVKLPGTANMTVWNAPVFLEIDNFS